MSWPRVERHGDAFDVTLDSPVHGVRTFLLTQAEMMHLLARIERALEPPLAVGLGGRVLDLEQRVAALEAAAERSAAESRAFSPLHSFIEGLLREPKK